MLIPSFRNEAEASAYAEVHKPLRTVLEQKAFTVYRDYARQYGTQAAGHAARCRAAAISGDQERLRMYGLALSLTVNPPVAREA